MLKTVEVQQLLLLFNQSNEENIISSKAERKRRVWEIKEHIYPSDNSIDSLKTFSSVMIEPALFMVQALCRVHC